MVEIIEEKISEFLLYKNVKLFMQEKKTQQGNDQLGNVTPNQTINTNRVYFL